MTTRLRQLRHLIDESLLITAVYVSLTACDVVANSWAHAFLHFAAAAAYAWQWTKRHFQSNTKSEEAG